jgi:signal transduction histidine kinase
MLLATPDGRIVAANEVACQMLRRTEEEIRKLQRTDMTVMDDAALAHFDRRDREGRSRARLTARRGDGTTFIADVSVMAFDAPEGPRIHVTLVDVTDDARARRALEVLAKSGRVLAESLDVKTTLQRFMSLVVPELADLCTIDLVEDKEIHRYVVAHRDPSQAELVKTVRRRGFKTGVGVEYVLQTGKPQLMKEVTEELARTSTHDEEHYQQAKKLGVRSYVSVPLVARGRTIGAFTLATTGGVPAYDEADLTLATALADQAALAVDNAFIHAAAIQATRLRDEVLEVVSHDLKNPLNTIKLSAGSLARRSDAEEIPVMRRAVERAERLIADLLLASKMDFTTIPLDRGPTSLRVIIDGVVALHKDAAAAKSLELVAVVHGDADVVVDRHRIAQMLDNLVGNAIKFTEKGSVEVRARAFDSTLVIEVQDTGPGIAPDAVAHVFDRFWQSAHAKRAGAGLGLAIAHGIAQAHGGDLTVTSAVDRGTTFVATLRTAPT